MRKYKQGSLTRYTFTADDTYNWAHRTGACWPGSALSGRRLSVVVDGNHPSCDLISLTVNGSTLPEGFDVPEHELSAFLADQKG